MKKVDSLLDQCCGHVAAYISEGLIRSCSPRLNEDLSNTVFNILINAMPLYYHDINHVHNVLTASKCVIIDHLISANHCTTVFKQNITRLELPEMYLWTMFHITREEDDVVENEDGEDEDDRDPIVDIEYLLTRLLNPISRKMLKHLTIDGNHVDFPVGWIDRVGSMLPLLESASFTFCGITQPDFNHLCNKFKLLTQLDITASEIESMEGIRNIVNLEILNISGICFESKDKVIDIFELKKLKCLDISGDPCVGKVNTLMLYLECEKCLPELTYIDCSDNYLSEELLKKLVATHEKLGLVGLIGTTLERREKFQNEQGRNVQLHTTENFAQCLVAMKSYIARATARNDIMEKLYERMSQCLSIDYKNQSFEDIHEFFELFFRLSASFNFHEESEIGALRCMKIICEDKRAGLFTYNQRQNLITTLVEIISDSDPDHLMDNSEQLRLSLIYEIWDNDIILETSIENLKIIADKAIAAVKIVNSLQPITTVPCISIILRCLRKLPEKGCEDLCTDLRLQEIILQFLEETNTLRSSLSHLLFDLLAELFQKRPRNLQNPENDVKCLKGMTKHFAQYRKERLNSINMLTSISHVAKCLNAETLSFFLESEQIEIYLEMLVSRYEDAKLDVLRIYGAVYLNQVNCRTWNAEIDDKQLEILSELLLHNVLQFKRTGYSDDVLDCLKWVQKTTNHNQCEDWVNWLIGSVYQIWSGLDLMKKLRKLKL